MSNRTATLIAITYDGKEVLLAGRTASLLVAREQFQKLYTSESSEKYRSLHYQESDGVEQVHIFRTAKEQEALKAAQAKADENTAKRLAESKKNPERFSPPPVEKMHGIMTNIVKKMVGTPASVK